MGPDQVREKIDVSDPRLWKLWAPYVYICVQAYISYRTGRTIRRSMTTNNLDCVDKFAQSATWCS